MSRMDEKAREVEELEADSALKRALGHFRQSLYAWSEAAYVHPRTAVAVAGRRSRRLVAGWALGCVLVAGSLAGGVYEHHHRQVIARIKADEARQQQLALQQRARTTDEDLLATVDRDISRAVPAAMEPLAQLMDTETDQ